MMFTCCQSLEKTFTVNIHNAKCLSHQALEKHWSTGIILFGCVADVNVGMTSQLDERVISLTVTRWQSLPWAFCCFGLKLFVWKTCLGTKNVYKDEQVKVKGCLLTFQLIPSSLCFTQHLGYLLAGEAGFSTYAVCRFKLGIGFHAW